MSDEKEGFEVEDFGVSDNFGEGINTPIPDAEDFKIPPAADAMKPERSEAHREAQRKGAINQWRAKDRRDGVPLPVKSSKAPSAAKRSAIENLLLMQRAEKPHIKKALEEFVRRTVEELGGWEFLTAGQKGMLVCQKTALLVILACEEQIVDSENLMEEDGKPHHLLGILRDYMATFRQGQVALGLGLRSRMPRADNQTVATVMAEYARRKQPQLVPEKSAKKASKDKAG